MKSKIEYKDFPLYEVAKEVEESVFPIGGHVYQKWTCQHCGARQTMEELDKFFTSGICEECKKVSRIDECNYIAMYGNIP